MSTTDTCRRRADAPIVDGDSTSMVTRYPKQLDMSYDLYQAIEDLRSVPVLRWPDVVTYDDDITCDEVHRTEYNAVTTNASTSVYVVQSELGNNITTSTAVTKVSTISSELPNVAQTDDDQPDWSKHIRAGEHDQSSSIKEQTLVSDAGNQRLSDDVFVDVATPIDADLLIDDVYEREMDELDQLDVEVIAADNPSEWLTLPPESALVDGFDQDIPHICLDCADSPTNKTLMENSTDNRLIHQRSCATERSFPPAGSAVELHCAEMHPQSVSINTTSSLKCSSTVASSCLDASAEELFEEIVESMIDTVAEDDAELDALVDAENQLMSDVVTTKSGPGKLETGIDRRNFVTEEFVDKNVDSPVQPLMLPLNSHSGSNDKQHTVEQQRQKDMTICLALTLNDCLDTLSQMDHSDRQFDDTRHHTTRVERYRKNDITSRDIMYSSSSTKSSGTNSVDRQCVTSSSSGFQSDMMDVDIDEEFDVNFALNAADLGIVRSDAVSTSLDSLLELNDDDESYSDQTVIRRPIPPTSKRSDSHSIVNGFVEKLTTPPESNVKLGAYVTATDRVEDVQTVKHDERDVTDKENGTVVTYNETSPTVEVLAEELITQEIVLNIVLPRRSKRKEKRDGLDGCVDSAESAEGGAIDHMKNCKSPHRDFHIHRVVRCSDADDRSDDRLEISEHPESKGQKSMTESDAVENGSSVNEDENQPDLSSIVAPGLSLASRYVGGPLSVELERNAESSTTEEMDDDTCLRVTRRNRFKVIRAPDGSGAALFNAPVTSIRHVVDDVGRTLAGDHRRQPVPPGARVTCEAVERKSSTSLPDGDVTVICRTIVDDSEKNRPDADDSRRREINVRSK